MIGYADDLENLGEPLDIKRTLMERAARLGGRWAWVYSRSLHSWSLTQLQPGGEFHLDADQERD